MKQKAIGIINKLISELGSQDVIAKAYFEQLLRVVELNLESDSYPKINGTKQILETYDKSLSANAMFLKWYDITSALRTLVEFNLDKIHA